MGEKLARLVYSTEWASPCAISIQPSMQKHPFPRVGKIRMSIKVSKEKVFRERKVAFCEIVSKIGGRAANNKKP